MLKLIIIAAAISFCAISLAEDSGGDLSIPGKFLEKGKTITCQSEGGCIIMTPKELAATANAIYRKTLEMHVCGLKNEV